MKNIIYILLILAMVMAGCVSKRSADKLAGEKDSLAMVVAEKDSIINEIFFSLNQISNNLAEIKQREKIITTAMQDDEISKEPTVQISEDIAAIDKMLQDNRATMARLQRATADLKKANVHIGELDKMIRELNSQIDARNSEIDILKEDLRKMNIKVDELSENVSALSGTVTTLTDDNTRLEGEVRATTDRMNTVYYIVGSQKELLSKEIIYKSGFIGRTLRLNENRSLDSFTQVDVRHFNEVIIGKKDVTLVTTHPAESYEMVMGDKGTFASLVIKDQAKFWEYSKVLVISFK